MSLTALLLMLKRTEDLTLHHQHPIGIESNWYNGTIPLNFREVPITQELQSWIQSHAPVKGEVIAYIEEELKVHSGLIFRIGDLQVRGCLYNDPIKFN